MSGFAWSRTQAETPLTIPNALLAGVIALVSPALLGAALTTLAGVLGAEESAVVFSIGYVLIFVPILGWIGLVPGMLCHWLAWRQGAGGFLPCLVIAAVLGLVLSNFFGPLAWVTGVPMAAMYWLALRVITPDSLIPDRGDTAE